MQLLVLFGLLWTSFSAVPYIPCSTNWTFVGPVGAAISNSPLVNNTGAVMSIVGGYNGVWFAGTVNSGVWRTSNITTPLPHWEPVTDNQPVTCVSIGAVAVADFNPKLVAAGCGGSTSSEMGYDWNTYNNGDWSGLMISLDNGDTWAMTNFPRDYYITSIQFISPQTIIVGTRSNFWNENNSGLFVSNDLGNTWNKTFDLPIFDIVYAEKLQQLFVAAVADSTVYYSIDFGQTWVYYSKGVNWNGYIPFYTTLGLQANTNPPILFIGGLAFSPNDDTVTASHVYYTPIAASSAWKEITGGPADLDSDHMPKDKMALLPDPVQTNLLYVAANGESTVYRVDYTKGAWTTMTVLDTSDHSQPHADCRRLAWEPTTNSLLLTTDGGVFRRTSPRQKGGTWRGMGGDMPVMELYFAHWDNRLRRWIAGAQDNDVQITVPASHGTLQSLGITGGDGTRTAIDNSNCPARLFGCTQFMAGLSVHFGDPLTTISIPLAEKFYTNQSHDFPYFVSAYAINSQDPTKLVYWVNGTDNGSRQSGFYEVNVPTSKSDVITPQLIANSPGVIGVYDLIAGGYTQGKSDANVLYAINNTHFMTVVNNQVVYKRLPTTYADPVHWTTFDSQGNAELGPLSHGITAWLSVSPADSNVVAITGWPVDWNNGQEQVWLSLDAGSSWKDITGNLYSATQTIERIRPSCVYIIEFSDQGYNAILVGTVTGVYVTFTDYLTSGLWSRVGLFSDLPHVMVLGISYEHYSDTLVAATFGRGVYILEQAKPTLLKLRAQQLQSTCDVSGPFNPTSSAQFFPPQKSC